MIEESDPKRLAQMALVVLLIIGCITVLLPFIGAVLFAFVVWMCTWRFYAEKLLPWLGGKIAGDAESYRYLAESIRMHPDQAALKAMMEQAGLERVEVFNLTAGVVALHRGYKF